MADYDVDKYNALISLEVPYKIALALASDDSPLIGGLPNGQVASNVAEIADTATATAEDVGDTVNEIISALINANLMEGPE